MQVASLRVGCGSLVVSVVLAFGARTADAAVLVVNSTADAVDAAPGDGVCATATAVCSLRAAIQETNALPGEDTIRVPSGTFQLSLTGGDELSAVGDLDILDDLVVKGSGPGHTIIDGNFIDRVFDCGPNLIVPKVELDGIRVKHGANYGAGILSTCDLAVTNSAVSDNQGNGIYVFDFGSRLTIKHSEVSGNSDSGILVFETEEDQSVEDCSFHDNEASFGAAIELFGNDHGPVTIKDSRFHGNSANFGGAIDGGGMFISGCTFDENVSFSNGSAILVADAVEIVNSTFSNNTATNGPAISSAAYPLSLNNVTFIGNTDLSNEQAAAVRSDELLLSNTLFSGNIPFNCDADSTVSLGHNMSDDDSCALTDVSDREGIAAIIDLDLKNNGGPTPTHALGGGEAVEGGSHLPVGSGGGACEALDQRGVDRPGTDTVTIEPLCDIGAFELCEIGTTGDSDGDDIADNCDPGDDNDGCPDVRDQHPKQDSTLGGRLIDFCGGSHPLSVFEGADSDDDGLLNCEDDDDDDDGVRDDEDNCIGFNCLKFGRYPCLPRFLECIGGGCVEFWLRFMNVVNPERSIDLQPTEIQAEAIYAAPPAGVDAHAAIEQIAGGSQMAFSNQVALGSQLAFDNQLAVGNQLAIDNQVAIDNPIALARTPRSRFALEIWSKDRRGRPLRSLARVAEFSRENVRLLPDNGGFLIGIIASAQAGDPLVLGTTFASGAPLTGLRDADIDGVPDAYDFCPWSPGGIPDSVLGGICREERALASR